jgi:DNA polymerase I
MLPLRMPRLLLVDGHSNLYRAFYAIRGALTAPDGTPTGATYGFLRIQQKLLRDLQPTHVGVVFDAPGETFRSRMDERYKAQRTPMPDDLRAQVPLTQEAARLGGLAVLAVADVEADDVIGTLASHAAAAGVEVVIASADKDLMQLVRDPLVRMWHTGRERLLDEHGVAEVFGVPPHQVTEVLSLMGDAADNIPGCPGIGEKTAKELIGRWGSVAAIYANLDEVTPPRARRALAEHRAEVELAQRLVRIRTDVEVGVAMAALQPAPPDRDGLAELYRRLGFASMLAELATAAAAPAPPAEEIRTVGADEIPALLAGAPPIAVAWRAGELAVAGPHGVAVATAEPRLLAGAVQARLGGLWCHDAKGVLARLGDLALAPAAVPRDTMLAAYLLAPGESVELDRVCRRLGAAPPGDDSSAAEARAVAAVAPLLQRRLEEEELEAVLRDIELPLVPVLEAMERTGIRLDAGALADLGERLGFSIAELERDIHAEAGGAFNINSPAQLAEVLFVRRSLPVLRKTAKTKAPSTDADVLAELAGRGFRLPALILDYREQTKLKSTYVDSLPRQIGGDGRIHTRFNQAVAATGRLSSSDPNLQNIPIRSELGREVRRAFVAEAGWTLLAADYSQVELRVLAHLSEEPALAAAFARGEDIHRATAALVFGIAPDLVSAQHRRAAKTINFGLIYGMGAFALGRDLGIPSAEAQGFIDAYFARMPRVREYLEGTKAEARHSGKVRTMFGRVRWIAGLDSANAQVRGNAERMAINAPVQGTAADLVKLAMIRLYRELAERALPARMLLQVHDELVLEVRSGAETEVADLVRSVMESAAELRVPLKVDLGTGASWADLKI